MNRKRLQILQKLLDERVEDLTQANNQLGWERDAVDQIRIQRRIDQEIDPDIRKLQEELREEQERIERPSLLDQPSDEIREEDWEELIFKLKHKSCMPVLGPDLIPGMKELRNQLASSWTDKYGYPPMQTQGDFTEIAQYVSIITGRQTAHREWFEALNKLSRNLAYDSSSPHAILAELKLPAYITTTHDDLMVSALQDVPTTEPHQEHCRWFQEIRTQDHDYSLNFEPTPDIPLVYHLLGSIRRGHRPDLNCLVLTEDDYFDFLVNVAKEPSRIPSQVWNYFGSNLLLFLGFQITDWELRTLLHLIREQLTINLVRGSRYGNHLTSVQIILDSSTQTVEKRTQVKEYLKKYFNRYDIRVYFGDSRVFLLELRERLRTFKGVINDV